MHNFFKTTFISITIFLDLILSPHVLYAQAVCPLDSLRPKEVKSLESFKRVLVLNQGRIKPLETYAQSLLLQFSGKRHYQKESAIQWLARFLFAPRATFNDKIFLINNPEILEALKVEPDKHRRYSYRQLEAGYDKLRELAQFISSIDEKKQSVVDKEILRVYSNVDLFLRLSGAFSFAVPHPDFNLESAETKALLGLPKDQNQFSFYDIIEKSEALNKVSMELQEQLPKDWTDAQKDVATIFNALDFWSQNYSNCPIGLIPSKSFEDEKWFSPMDTILFGFQDPVYNQEIKFLREMAIHYWNGSQLEFDTSVKIFNSAVLNSLSSKEKKSADKLEFEIIYNKLNLFSWARFFYLAGFFLFLFSLMYERKWLYTLTLATTALAVVPHTVALILRVFIMSRPPVSNLFETFIFVGLIGAALGIILEVINKNWLGLVVANSCGAILLMIADKFSSDGDTMQMLVAVLNSNFWLSTHVIAITVGYAGCCVAGVMGHIYILQALSSKIDAKRLDVTYKNMMGVLAFGLIMSFLGTALGGIWADQSWGRFWGWDPKENGALMIVLWCSIIFHSRIAKIINPLGAAVGCIFTLINVMWAWFGVNLLSVGLHSYGFTSGIANVLLIYVFIEIFFISIAVFILGKRNIKF